MSESKSDRQEKSYLPPLPGQEVVKPEPKKKVAKKKTVAKAKPSGPKVVTKALKAPIMVGWVGYSQRRVDLRLEAPQADSLRDLLQGLTQDGATLKNGKFVQRPNEALKWLLENIS